MENSINNSVRRTAFANRQRTIYEEGLEESSWTMYFEDFFSLNHDHDHDYDHDHDGDEDETEDRFGCYVDDSSMISDAASPAAATAKKKARRNSFRMTSSSKRRRIVHEHQEQGQEQEQEQEDVLPVTNDLEDTASSPSNSPKGYSLIMDQISKNPTQGETGDITHKRECIDDAESEINTMNERSVVLKKKGLCLVPLSMLSTYLS